MRVRIEAHNNELSQTQNDRSNTLLVVVVVVVVVVMLALAPAPAAHECHSGTLLGSHTLLIMHERKRTSPMDTIRVDGCRSWRQHRRE